MQHLKLQGQTKTLYSQNRYIDMTVQIKKNQTLFYYVGSSKLNLWKQRSQLTVINFGTLNTCTSIYLKMVWTATIVLQSASVSSSAEFDDSLFTITMLSARLIPARSKSSILVKSKSISLKLTCTVFISEDYSLCLSPTKQQLHKSEASPTGHSKP